MKLPPKGVIIFWTVFLLFLSVPFFAEFFGVGVRRERKSRSVMHEGCQIFKSLVNFSAGNYNFYPDGANANEALGELVDDMEGEDDFFVRGSPWHGTRFARGPDNLWKYSNPKGTALEAGENAWSYTRGLTPESSATIPILATIVEDHSRFGTQRMLVLVYANGRGETRKIKYGQIIIRCPSCGGDRAE